MRYPFCRIRIILYLCSLESPNNSYMIAITSPQTQFTLLADRLDIDAERALDILYNSRTYALLENPDSGLQLQSDQYILADILRELE